MAASKRLLPGLVTSCADRAARSANCAVRTRSSWQTGPRTGRRDLPYRFPFVLLGLVVIGAAPVYRFGSGGRFSCGVTRGPVGNVVRTCFFSYGWPAFIYWMIALVLAYAVIAGFYLLRARKRGVGSRVRLDGNRASEILTVTGSGLVPEGSHNSYADGAWLTPAAGRR